MEYLFAGQVFFDEDISFFFDEDISSWGVGQVTSMQEMFYEATVFRGNLNKWNVSRVTNMYGMFQGAKAYDSDLSSWDIAGVEFMEYMFLGASSFSQDLCAWAEQFEFIQAKRYMFQDTNCTFQHDPEKDQKGPFCASTCQSATVAWSTVR